MKTEHPTHTLWQRFIGASPLAVLSMWGPYSSIVWSVPNSQFDELMGLSDEQFLNRLNETLRSDSIKTRSVVQKYLHAEQKLEPPFVSLSVT